MFGWNTIECFHSQIITTPRLRLFIHFCHVYIFHKLYKDSWCLTTAHLKSIKIIYKSSTMWNQPSSLMSLIQEPSQILEALQKNCWNTRVSWFVPVINCWMLNMLNLMLKEDITLQDIAFCSSSAKNPCCDTLPAKLLKTTLVLHYFIKEKRKELLQYKSQFDPFAAVTKYYNYFALRKWIHSLDFVPHSML